jgi:hypothetical protein
MKIFWVSEIPQFLYRSILYIETLIIPTIDKNPKTQK